ncbi:winged helix-turn-helix domain-containing protein [Pararobbsia silviterrae]|uniref:DNA-binding response regulator n=1 Tax=Pararobbsia silviterrae TaxID=1792498 RepID=A0A494XMV0_9BURK|nr:winged helix-turn-helix domain-containing protein [Pararobbsia silviterrae]RKP51948.1 DNA-binding response regulator [Pararobbsia silviterrae]
MRILLIAADSVQTRYLSKALTEAAHSLECQTEWRDAIFVASSERFDAVVLHANAFEDIANADIVSSVRELAGHTRGATLAVIADLPDPAVRSELLWLGVDACFTRQFSFMELHERLRRLDALRIKRRDGAPRAPGETSRDTTDDTLKLDASARAAVQGDRRAALSRHEFMVLECLLRAREATMERAEMTRYAWPDKDEINPAGVNLVISHLRKKLDAACFDVRIETVAGVGYRLVTSRAMQRAC